MKTTLDQYKHIITQKTKFINEKNWNKACLWRQKEINFMMENFQIDIRSQFIKDLEKGLDTNMAGIINI